MAKNCQPSFAFSKTPTMPQQNQDSPSFTTLLSDPHFNLSAHTFAIHTLPFSNISFVLDLLTDDDAATQNLLTLDRINQTIVSLERQLDENHRLAARHFSTLLQRQTTRHLPQQLHEYLHPDCGRCRLRHRWPTPFSSPAPSSSSSTCSPPSSSTRSRRTSPYSRPLPSLPSSSATIPPPFPPLITHSRRVYPRNYFEANAADCLQRLQTIPEEQWWGTAPFPIIVEAPEAEDDIFQRYYRWFINEGRD